jgi:hypothetical protein
MTLHMIRKITSSNFGNEKLKKQVVSLEISTEVFNHFSFFLNSAFSGLSARL